MTSSNIHSVPTVLQDDHDWRVDSFSGLDEEQRRAYDAAMFGGNVLVVGHAMSGKSNLLRIIEIGLQEQFGPDVYVVVTNPALAHFPNWVPIDIFFGISSYDQPLEEQHQEAKGHDTVIDRWRQLQALIIDDGECFLFFDHENRP